MVKNEIYEIEITGLTSEGNGVGRIDGMAVFVPYALPEETVRVKILKVNKSYAYGKMLDVLKPSPERTAPLCPVFFRCGGCGLRHMTYNAELKFKTDKVRQDLKRIGGLDIPVENCEPSPEISGYRNKAQYPVGASDGKICTGFFAKRTHDIIPIDSCLIQSDFSRIAADSVKEYMKRANAAPYDEKSGKGCIRHIYVRNSKKEALLTIVTAYKNIPCRDLLVDIVRKNCPFVCGIVQNVNPKKTNVVMGSENITLWGEPYLTDKLCGLKFEISPMSFYQVNHDQTERLYACAAELAEVKNTDTVLDLYCGIGTISLFMARHAGKVYGVEIVPQAIENAKKNAEINGIENAEFVVGDAKTAAERFSDADVVIIDPPRAGCDAAVIDHIVRIAPERVVYVSCNPSTLARDLKIFSEKGYEPKIAHPFDLFPRTEHVETVCLLLKTEANK